MKAAESALTQIAKGPTRWASSQDLYQLKEAYGQTISFNNIEWMAKASKARVLHADKGIPSMQLFLRDVNKLRTAWVDGLCGRFIDWYYSSFIMQLYNNDVQLMEQYGSLNNIRIARKTNPVEAAEDESWSKEIQQATYRSVLASHTELPTDRIRQKMVRFELQNFSKHGHIPGGVRQQTPAWRSRRCYSNLTALNQIVPPRVQAAAWGAIWNRWTTEARFQRKENSQCLLCSSTFGTDSLEHYSRCRVTRRLLRAKLNLDPDKFAGMHAWTLSSPWIATKEELAGVALTTYAVYTVTNRLRHMGQSNLREEEHRYEALVQAIKEGVKGHEQASKILRNRWTSGRQETQLVHVYFQNPLKARLLALRHNSTDRRVRQRLS